MVYQFRVHCPGNDLHGETKEFQSTSYAVASQRAYAWLADTFSLSTAEPHLVFVGEYASRKALEKAEESGVALAPLAKTCPALMTSDVDMVLAVALAEDLAPLAKTKARRCRHDYSDSDICNRCDMLRAS